MERLRSPIIVTVGHVDHGKTSLLDKIRGTAVTKLEPGMLSQHVGASYIPLEIVKRLCGRLLNLLQAEILLPGLLLVDTPGHAAFITLRKRGGSVADLAILVIDITEGFQEQTDESLAVLKQYKTPFVVAATKIDKIPGWFPYPNACFSESFQKQAEDVKQELDKKIYMLISQLLERGFDAERFDRIEDFTKKVAIVPVSSITGEGIPELLMVLLGLSQHFLKERLKLSEITRGTVLEVKETKGFGTTIDIILYDGCLKKGDYLVIGGTQPIVTRIKALLLPRPGQELRVEKQFMQVDEVCAAAGVKISAPDLEMVKAGSPVLAVSSEDGLEAAMQAVQKEVEGVEFTKQLTGVIIKADTLGSLEAMIKLLTEEGIPIRKAEVGHVTKQDIIEGQNVTDSLRRVVLAFNVKVLEEAKSLAKDLDVKIFTSDVIYRLVDEYKQWCDEKKEQEIQEKLAKVTHPVKIKLLKGFTFRASNPMVVGVEVLAGLLRPGVLMRKEGKIVGRIKEIQREGKTIEEATKGDKVAISMEEPVMGRTVQEGDVLISVLSEEDLNILRGLIERLREDEKELLAELAI